MKKLALIILSHYFYSTGLLCQPIVKIYGNDTADSLHTVMQVNHCLQLLQVDEKICICVRISEMMPEGVKGITLPLNTEAKNKVGQALPVYQIRIDAGLSNKQRSVALVHEMIHLKQYVRGELRNTKNNGFLWKGEVYKYLVASDRFTSPWEQEAYGLDNQLADMVQKDTRPYPLVQQLKKVRSDQAGPYHVEKNKNTNY